MKDNSKFAFLFCHLSKLSLLESIYENMETRFERKQKTIHVTTILHYDFHKNYHAKVMLRHENLRLVCRDALRLIGVSRLLLEVHDNFGRRSPLRGLIDHVARGRRDRRRQATGLHVMVVVVVMGTKLGLCAPGLHGLGRTRCRCAGILGILRGRLHRLLLKN